MLADGERWRVIEGDALAVLATLPNASFDAVITDPPYCAGAISEAQRTRSNGQGLRSENIKRFGWFVGDNMGTAGLTWLLRAVAVEALRVVKPTGHLLIFCDWRMLSMLQPAVESAGLRYQGLVVWDKGLMGLGTGFRHRHELIMHFTMGSPEYYDRGTGDVLTCPRVARGEREHQTQKPVELLRQLVKVTAPPDGLVLDPFVGSGTTIISALAEGRRAVGIESDPGAGLVARRRLGDPDALPPTGGLFAGLA
jgi:DNA modification methylase